MASAEIDGLSDKLVKTSIGEGGLVLSIAGEGLKLDGEEDVAKIAEAIEANKNLSVLDLKGNTLGIDAAKALGAALTKHSELKRALWSDLFTGRLKTEIPAALKFLCNGLIEASASLVELDLSDNALGPNGMTGVVDFLKGSCCFSLQELRLNNNGLGPEGGTMLADSLLECYEASVVSGRPLALRVFVSGRGRLEDEGAKALANVFRKMQSLEQVVMPQNGINHRGITVLAEALVSNRNLRHLNLSDNTFTEKGSISMAQAMTSLKKLEFVNFEDCLMRKDGAKALASALKGGGHRKLKVLKLGGNEIDGEGALAIAEAMVDKEELELLDLNANQLGDDGIDKLRSIMEGIGRLDQLASLSEDEGSECEDENEADDSDEEPEDDEDGDEAVGCGLEIRGQGLTPRPSDKTSDVEHEDDEDGDEAVGCGLEIKGQGLTPRPSDKTESSLEDEMSNLKL